MTAFLYGARLWENPTDPARPITQSLREFRGPILPSEGMLYMPCTSRLRMPNQFYFANAKLRCINLVMVLDNLKRVDRNVETYDQGVLLQFGSVQEAVLFKLSW